MYAAILTWVEQAFAIARAAMLPVAGVIPETMRCRCYHIVICNHEAAMMLNAGNGQLHPDNHHSNYGMLVDLCKLLAASRLLCQGNKHGQRAIC